MDFLKNYYLSVHVAVTLKKHLQNLKIITNVNVTSANHQKCHAKQIVHTKNSPIQMNWASTLTSPSI